MDLLHRCLLSDLVLLDITNIIILDYKDGCELFTSRRSDPHQLLFVGRLARIYQHTMPREFIDFEIRQALEWLLSGHHFRATTAVCVLAELLQNVPTLINVEVSIVQHVISFCDQMLDRKYIVYFLANFQTIFRNESLI